MDWARFRNITESENLASVELPIDYAQQSCHLFRIWQSHIYMVCPVSRIKYGRDAIFSRIFYGTPPPFCFLLHKIFLELFNCFIT